MTTTRSTHTSSPARDRVLQAALDCFAEKGYAATTINDIESAAGLTPGCGGTYRHFPSKQSMLEAAVERMLDDSDDAVGPRMRTPQEAVRDALAMLDRHERVRRLLARDLDEFPELKARVTDRVVERAFRTATASAAEYVPHADTDAMAAVMVSAVSGFRMVESILGHPPLGVSDERFVETWATAFEGLIRAAFEGPSDAS